MTLRVCPFMGAEGQICSLETLLLNSPFLVQHIPSPPHQDTVGMVGWDSYNISLGGGGRSHHPYGNIILSFPRCQWERILELEVLAQKETRVSMQKER